MSDSRGFTLVEVLIAGAMLVIVLIPAAAMMVNAYSTLDRAGEQTAALALAEQRVELLRNQAFDAAMLAAGTSTESLSGTYAGYTRATTITDDTPRAGIKRIVVLATSPSGRQVVLTTLISE